MKKTAFVILTTISITLQVNAQIKGLKYGSQVWMAENLSVSNFRNGDRIPEAKTQEEWAKAGVTGKPAWCYYDNDPVNGDTYGKLYNWYAITDPRGLAPQGWHVPTSLEWLQLCKTVGGMNNAGDHLKAATGWDGEEYIPDTTKAFNALPGGARALKFQKLNDWAYFWTTTEDGEQTAWAWTLWNVSGNASRYNAFKFFALSVRCVHD